MSSRPASELMTIAKQRGLGFERFFRELSFMPHRQMGWYGSIGKDHIVYLGYTLDAAREMLNALPVKKVNGKIAAAVSAASTPKPAAPIATTTARRRSNAGAKR